MNRRVAWLLWVAAAAITGSCAGFVSNTFPDVAAWLGVALALATVGAALLLYGEDTRDRPRR